MKTVNHKNIHQLRIKIWIRVAMNLIGVDSGYGAQKHITPEKFEHIEGSTKFPRKYTRYIYDNPAPEPKNKTLTVTEINIPKSRVWFDMPLWESLLIENITEKDIENLVLEINDKDTHEYLLTEGSNINNISVGTDNISYRLNELRMYEPPDSLSSIVILLLQAELESKHVIRLELLNTLNDILLSCLAIYDLDIDFIGLYKICYERFHYKWNDQDHLDDTAQVYLNEEIRSKTMKNVKIRKRLINMATSAKITKEYIHKLIILDKYSEQDATVLGCHIKLFDEDIEKFDDALAKFLMSLYGR